jgi:hypothetical protein
MVHGGNIPSGFSNFLYNQMTVSLVGSYIVLSLYSFFVIVGALMMTNRWNKLPSLKEFDWISKMERLLIVHLETSLMLFEFNFRINGQTESEQKMDGDLAGSAISGINMVLKEILSSKGYIK